MKVRTLNVGLGGDLVRADHSIQLEAASARKRLLESQSSSTAQIHEAAWQREVMRIYHEACIETKAVYRFGHDEENRAQPDNWIIRWTLWQ